MAWRQYDVWNINELELSRRRAASEEAQISLMQAALNVQAARTALAERMGLSAQASPWPLATAWPTLPQAVSSEEELIAWALANRYDLSAQREEVETFERALALTWWGIFTRIDVGVETEREPDGVWLTGPSFAFEVPLFNFGQADIARDRALLRQSQERLAAMENSIIAQMRQIHARLLVSHRTAQRLERSLIPLRERILELSRLHYNRMQVGVFELLQTRSDEVESRIALVRAQRDHWIATADLVRASGGVMPAMGGLAGGMPSASQGEGH